MISLKKHSEDLIKKTIKVLGSNLMLSLHSDHQHPFMKNCLKERIINEMLFRGLMIFVER